MALSIPNTKLDKIGWVSEFTLEVNETPDRNGRLTFFRFTVTDDISGGTNPSSFVMSRDSQCESDNPANPWKGLTFSSVQVAAVAAVKDAYMNHKRIRAIGFGPTFGAGMGHFELFRLTLTERTGQYRGTPVPGPICDSTGRPKKTQRSQARVRPRRQTKGR